MTVRAGSIGHWWHATHILLSTLTCGWWLIIYAAHAIIATVTRPTIEIEVPEGHRIEYRHGWPNVLAPDEYLEPRTIREKAMLAAAYGSPVLIIAGIVAGAVLRG